MSQNQDVCPREASRHDLSKLIKSIAQKGDQIVLCIDLSKDVNQTNGPIQQTLLHNNNLINVLKYRHHISTPATHNRGTKTIDAIFVSPKLADCDFSGWLKFGQGISDHCIAFLDINLTKLICKDKYDIVKKKRDGFK